MEILGQIVAEFVLGMLLNYPGAAIRWIFLRGKKPFTRLKDDYELNYFVAVLLIGMIIAIKQFN